MSQIPWVQFGSDQSAILTHEMPDGLGVQFYRYPMEGIEELWRSFEGQAEVSFFQSWAWIGQWLQASPHLDRLVAVIFRDNNPAGLGILTLNRAIRLFGPNKTVVSLHANGVQREDRLAVEYNGLISPSDFVETAHYCLASALRAKARFAHDQPPWLEARFPGCGPGVVSGLTRAGMPFRTYRNQSAPYVDLTTFQGGLQPYLSTRSANTRHQIRRSIRLLEGGQGDLVLRRAVNETEARTYFDELITLHQKTWQRRGHPGAFADPYFTKFHEEMLQHNVEPGHADVLRVHNEHSTVGVLYNFVHDDTVYAYQSGFISHQDNRIKPGLVCHAMAIAHYQDRGLHKYCFLAGEDRYKKSLSTGADTLHWIALQRPDLQMRVENFARKVKNALRFKD